MERSVVQSQSVLIRNEVSIVGREGEGGDGGEREGEREGREGEGGE